MHAGCQFSVYVNGVRVPTHVNPILHSHGVDEVQDRDLKHKLSEIEKMIIGLHIRDDTP